jgi:hypothetical protein
MSAIDQQQIEPGILVEAVVDDALIGCGEVEERSRSYSIRRSRARMAWLITDADSGQTLAMITDHQVAELPAPKYRRFLQMLEDLESR